jgi:hypothetical protein
VSEEVLGCIGRVLRCSKVDCNKVENGDELAERGGGKLPLFFSDEIH